MFLINLIIIRMEKINPNNGKVKVKAQELLSK